MKLDTGQPPPPSSIPASPHKGCNSSTCCSPARLWRTLQNLIKQNDRKGLLAFFKDPRLEHIVRVALTSRVSNDGSLLPASQRHTLVRFASPQLATEALPLLGKRLTDLNALQLALLESSESTVMALLTQLKLHASTEEMKSFVQHVWGQGNTSLHLAVFLNRPRVVKALLDLGASVDCLNAKQKSVIDCCRDQSMLDILLPPQKKKVIQHELPNMEPIVVKDEPVVAKDEPMVEPMVVTEERVQNTISYNNNNNNNESAMLALEQYLLLLKHHVQQQQQFNTSTAAMHYSCAQTVISQFMKQSVYLSQEKKPPDILLVSA